MDKQSVLDNVPTIFPFLITKTSNRPLNKRLGTVTLQSGIDVDWKSVWEHFSPPPPPVYCNPSYLLKTFSNAYHLFPPPSVPDWRVHQQLIFGQMQTVWRRSKASSRCALAGVELDWFYRGGVNHRHPTKGCGLLYKRGYHACLFPINYTILRLVRKAAMKELHISRLARHTIWSKPKYLIVKVIYLIYIYIFVAVF